MADERGDAVAQPRGALEIELLGGLLHVARELLAHGAAFAGQEVARLAARARHIRMCEISPVHGPEQRLIW